MAHWLGPNFLRISNCVPKIFHLSQNGYGDFVSTDLIQDFMLGGFVSTDLIQDFMLGDFVSTDLIQGFMLGDIQCMRIAFCFFFVFCF